MPNVQSGTMWRGLAIGVYGKAWPMMPTATPLICLITYGGKTGSPKSVVATFWAMKSTLPLKSLATISLTRSAPRVNSQCPVITSTPRARQASTMSCPFDHSAVALPCQVSPPSRSSAPGREALRFFTSVARCANPPTLP